MLPVAMDMRRAEGEGIVDECRINHHATLSTLQKVGEVKQMTVAAAYPVTGAVLVQHEDLARREPALHNVAIREKS